MMQIFCFFFFPLQTLQELLQRGLYHMQRYCEWNQTARQCSTRAADLDNTTAVGWAVPTGLLFLVTLCQPWACSALRRTTGVKVKLMLQSNTVCVCLLLSKPKWTFLFSFWWCCFSFMKFQINMQKIILWHFLDKKLFYGKEKSEYNNMF